MTARDHLATAYSLTEHVCKAEGHPEPLDSACVGCAIAAEIDAAMDALDTPDRIPAWVMERAS